MRWRDELGSRLSKPAYEIVRSLTDEEADALEEIRFRLCRPTELVFANERKPARFVPDRVLMDELVAALSGYALYACEKQMAQGYIPLPGGHRAGVCGRIIVDSHGVRRMACISSVCIRIARRVQGASITVRPYLLDESGRPLCVVLLGAPGCGKTTTLCDAAVYLSDRCGFHVAVADEREELCVCCAWEHEGLHMDVVTGINKADAMMMLIRTASPQVIVTDEIGRNEDAAAILEAARCGIGLIATMHGGEFEAMLARPVFRMLAQSGVVDRFILLGRRGTCDGVWDGSGHRCQLTEG